MKVGVCAFSGAKVYPGRGALMVRKDGKVYRLLNRKTRTIFAEKKDPKKYRWTFAYRASSKKEKQENVRKIVARKVVKGIRGIAGAPLEFIQARRNQTSEEREQERKKHAEETENARKKVLKKENSMSQMSRDKIKSAKQFNKSVRAHKPMVRGK